MSRKKNLRRRIAVTGALTGAAVVALAVPAAAHVTVSSDDSVRGADDAVVTFRVPNEEDSARVTKVEVTLPTTDPLASASPVVKPGWTITTTPVTFPTPITTDDGTITTGTGTITWTATPGGGVPVGQADTFQALVGPLPDTGELAFRAVQTYSDGTVVSWNQPTLAGQPEPDHPAPVLTLAAAQPAGTAAPTRPGSGDSAGTGLGIAGIVLGALGIGTGAYAVQRARRSGPEA